MPPTALKAEPDLVKHLGFILSEEEALKSWLTGIKVPTRPGESSLTDVGMWFRWPEGERQIQYPYITIDLLDVEPNFDLWTSTYVQDPKGLYQPSVSPTIPQPPWPGMGARVHNYLAMDLTWQVAVYARSALHDRYLTSIFHTDILPMHPFWILNPADNVYRRTERVGFQAADSMETTESGTKRIFRKIYTITMLTEIPQDVFSDIYVYQALRVLIPVVAREQFDSYYRTILNGHADPIGEFSDEERQEAGEYFYIHHQGINTPSA